MGKKDENVTNVIGMIGTSLRASQIRTIDMFYKKNPIAKAKVTIDSMNTLKVLMDQEQQERLKEYFDSVSNKPPAEFDDYYQKLIAGMNDNVITLNKLCTEFFVPVMDNSNRSNANTNVNVDMYFKLQDLQRINNQFEIGSENEYVTPKKLANVMFDDETDETDLNIGTGDHMDIKAQFSESFVTRPERTIPMTAKK